MKIKLLLALLVGVAFSSLDKVQLFGQISKGKLKTGESQTFEISSDQKHQFKLELNENQYAFVELMQKGVDVRVRTYDPKGVVLEEFDSPNGKQGLEIITLNSGKNGTYVVEVIPFDESEPDGEYDLTLAKVIEAPTTIEGKVDLLLMPWDSDETPGAAVAVVKDGDIVFKKGYGVANLEYGIPISPKTVFHIASVSKQFTVFSILLLENEGKLSLDDDIRKYIPEVPDFGKTITLKHLASHTSGLRDQWAILGMAGWRNDDVITTEHILKLVAKQKALNFEPGEEFAYCNTGFTLLAEVVSRASGTTFAQFTQQEIFQPLKMSDTLFYDDHETIVKNRAYSYENRGELKKSALNFANVGATSLFTSAEDLCLWASNFGSLTVGDEGIVNKMNTLAILNNGEKFGGALGQFVGKYKGLNEIQHAGGDAGYRSFLTRFPDQGLSVVVLCNGAEFNPVKLGHSVVDIYLEGDFKVEPEQPTPSVPQEAVGSPDEFDRSSVNLAEFSGRFYSEELSTQYKFKIIDGALVAQHRRVSDMRLTPIAKDTFAGFYGRTKFVRNDDDSITGLNVSDGRVRNVWFQKID